MRTEDDHAPCASVWTGIRTDRASAFDASVVEISGWMMPLDRTAAEVGYFLLASDEPCCGGCVPRDPFSCIEVVSREPIAFRAGPVRLRGRLLRLADDPAGWRYRRACQAVLQPIPMRARRPTRPITDGRSALAGHPGARSRLITADHARAVADTGGVIGVWPSSGTFHDLDGMAHGFKRMADVVGVEHVGLGTDMLGFIAPPVFRSYEQLPALLAAGFSQTESEQVLGGNYRRVFEATMS